MPTVGDTIVLARRETLPPAAAVLGALRDAGLHVDWQAFGSTGEGQLGGYLVAEGDPSAQGFVSVATKDLSSGERSQLAAHARELGSEAADSIERADVSVRITGTDGPELDWRAAFDTTLRTILAAKDAVAYLVDRDEFRAGGVS